MKKYVFSFKDDQIQMVHVTKIWQKVKVNSSQIILNDLSNRNFDLVAYNENLMTAVSSFIGQSQNTARKADFIIGLDNVIVRTVEIPYLSSNDLRDYIRGNISSYFTVNMDEFYYDYRVLNVNKDVGEGKKMMTIMLATIPTATIQGVVKFAEVFKLKIGKIRIYPDVMMNFADNNRNLAVLDIGTTKSIITIFEQGKTFLFSSIFQRTDEVDGVADLMDEIEYFTDFFASRHQGQKLDSLFVMGKHSDDAIFIENVGKRLGIPIDEIDWKKWRKHASEKEIEAFAEVISSQVNHTYIYQKDIDFNNAEKLKTSQPFELRTVHVLCALLVLTGLWFIPTWMHLTQQITKLQLSTPPIVSDVTATLEIDRLNSEREHLNWQKDAMYSILEKKVETIEIMEQIKKALPNDSSLKSIEIDYDKVLINFLVGKNAMATVNLVIAINQLNYFEKINLTELLLDDTNEGFTCVLKLKQ